MKISIDMKKKINLFHNINLKRIGIYKKRSKRGEGGRILSEDGLKWIKEIELSLEEKNELNKIKRIRSSLSKEISGYMKKKGYSIKWGDSGNIIGFNNKEDIKEFNKKEDLLNERMKGLDLNNDGEKEIWISLHLKRYELYHRYYRNFKYIMGE